MALTFSKIDAIIENEEHFEDTAISGMSMEQNSSFLDGSGVNVADFDGVSASIQGALASWDERNFLTTIQNYYKNAKYFGISALGSAPDVTTGKINNLRPYRVLDPLVWILHELGYSLKKSK